jgi:hypothetical protein
VVHGTPQDGLQLSSCSLQLLRQHRSMLQHCSARLGLVAQLVSGEELAAATHEPVTQHMVHPSAWAFTPAPWLHSTAPTNSCCDAVATCPATCTCHLHLPHAPAPATCPMPLPPCPHRCPGGAHLAGQGLGRPYGGGAAAAAAAAGHRPGGAGLNPHR